MTYSADQTLVRLRPFVADLGARIANGQNFEKAVLLALRTYPDAQTFLRIEPEHLSTTFGLKDEYLCCDWRPATLEMQAPGMRCHITLAKNGNDSLGACKDFMETLTSDLGDADSASRLSAEWSSVAERLLEFEYISHTQQNHLALSSTLAPGIYRLQHASVLYRTTHTTLLVDPHLHSIYGASVQHDLTAASVIRQTDAILITHFHEDHWFLATLMMFPRDTMIIVPYVPQTTIICGDMLRILQSIGYCNVHAPQWNGDPITVGDIDIHVRPFYGEQPLRYEHARTPWVRNWGNTYVLKSEHSTAWLLVDSGIDVDGSMLDVAEEVHAMFGSVDFLLGNLQRFRMMSPFYINGGLNWLTLRPDQLRRFNSLSGDCLTLGSDNVAAICAITHARWFLPYAHWWGEIGEVIRHEETLQEELRFALRRRMATTEIVRWRIGDGVQKAPNTGLRVLGDSVVSMP